MNIRVEGAGRVGQALSAAAQQGPQALAQALFVEAEQIMTASKRDYVPVDTGALRASGFVEPPVGVGAGVSVTLGYGGPAAPYALYVHEDLTKRHKVGQAKYLETPMRAALQGMPAVAAQRVNQAIRQSFQRLGRIERNIAAGRDPLSGFGA